MRREKSETERAPVVRACSAHPEPCRECPVDLPHFEGWHLIGAERLILAPAGPGHLLPWGVLAQHTGWQTSTGQPPPVSPYASASSKAAKSTPLLEPGQLQLKFDKRDVLEYSSAEDPSGLRVMLAEVCLVTIMFTLNELFMTRMTQSDLLGLAARLGSDVPFFIVHSAAICRGCTGRCSRDGRTRQPVSWTLLRLPAPSLDLPFLLRAPAATRY